MQFRNRTILFHTSLFIPYSSFLRCPALNSTFFLKISSLLPYLCYLQTVSIDYLYSLLPLLATFLWLLMLFDVGAYTFFQLLHLWLEMFTVCQILKLHDWDSAPIWLYIKSWHRRERSSSFSPLVFLFPLVKIGTFIPQECYLPHLAGLR